MFGDRDLVTMGDDELRSVRGEQIAVVFQDPMTSLNPVMGRSVARSGGACA